MLEFTLGDEDSIEVYIKYQSDQLHSFTKLDNAEALPLMANDAIERCFFGCLILEDSSISLSGAGYMSLFKVATLANIVKAVQRHPNNTQKYDHLYHNVHNFLSSVAATASIASTTTSQFTDEAELIDENDEQQFLACADYLSNYGLLALIHNSEAATMEVLKGKQLKDFFNVAVLHDTIIHILENLMIMGSPHHWVGYLMPEDAGVYKFVAASSSSGSDLSNATKFELLMGETRAVLSSAEFANIVDISLRRLVNGVLEDLSIHCGENNLATGMPLARLLPRIAHMGQLLLTESNRNRKVIVVESGAAAVE
ncbi:UNVERIFIED_CONTAM: Peroxisome biogenesis protein 3-2 [Sesamum calycinum]|uniref:Peroxisome biogenesis protein 3-2 n=1 Tax=Sesamum calycinum TaxID=2727403 RepID=A0AAW2SXP5_9LAMI